MQDLWLKLCARIGEDPHREGLKNTPERVKVLWDHLMQGYSCDPEQILQSAFSIERCDGIIVLKDIEFYSMCEHHLLPFFGHVSVGYIPKDKVVGLDAIAKLVEAYSRRLQIQERLSEEIASTFERILQPKGVGVFCVAKHLCMAMRGVQKQEALVKTSALKGLFKSDARTRAEFMQLLQS
ncbi:GTP cyclohydrolase I FolE [Helicobacter labacensis]|uniref:GTP cyclohydrolase I FolE n=1 Tax=Helicobacter labacensis TaxID=2316079 RepID=UPI000EAEF1DB|nr:GTP cyclohydrolase I FolE [Helicobacter labacensis]